MKGVVGQRETVGPRLIFSEWRNENSPSRLATDGVSNSFAIRTEISFALLEANTNVPGGAH